MPILIKSYKLQPVTCFQIFSLFFVSRILVSLTYIPSLNYQQAKGDLLLSVLTMLPLLIIFFLPVYFYMKVYGNENLGSVARRMSKPVGTGISLLYFLWFIYVSALNVTRFVYFVTSELNPDASNFLLILLVIAAACYGAYLGTQSLGRVAVIVLWFILISFIFVMLFALPDFRFSNFSPILENKLSDNMLNAVSLASSSAEITLLPFLVSKMKGTIRKKHFISWSAGIVLLVFALYFVTIGTLGDFAKTQSFPIYAMSQISGVGMLQRLDAVHTSIWIIALFLKVALFLVAAGVALRSVTPKLKVPWTTAIGGALMIVLAYIMSLSFPNYWRTSEHWTSMIPFLLFAVLIPLVFVLLAKKRKGGASVEIPEKA